ncbi:MAG: LytTR family DNA-binding domain-containing protein [Lachnospiraceae bacterium]|nr:LytTR family DNA-binding domain-containing protein [Lachnospiraceae bacterium]
MFTVAIVEDEVSCSRILTEFLNRYGEEKGLEFKIVHFRNGLDIVDQYTPIYDLIFLDIDMPLMDGLSAAEKIRRKDESVVIMFVTNLAQYAIRGYEVNALDYVLKPITYDAFSLKIFKAINTLNRRTGRSIVLFKNGEAVKISLNQLQYVEILNHRLIYHTMLGDFHEFKSMKEAEKELGEGFARCNQCYLVNLKLVKGIKDDCVMVGNDRLRISRPKKKVFMARLAEYYQYGE